MSRDPIFCQASLAIIRNMGHHHGWLTLLPSLVIVAWGLYFYGCGWKSYKISLEPTAKNHMTYMRGPTVFTPIRMDSHMGGGILKKVEHGGSKSSRLNPQPVLFIPGHLGSHDQVRSLASDMHNNGTFQYFTLGFSEEFSALHGSYIMNQAAFVNDALVKIYGMYKAQIGEDEDKVKDKKSKSKKNKNKASKKPKSPPRITIVAHSYGGLVARTAILLGNHPRCAVSSLFMLSSPNMAPSYAADASLGMLIDAVNVAWRGSYFNSTKLCATRAFTTQAGEPLSSPKSAGGDWRCPLCIPRLRVVSITGGLADELVAPHLTALTNIDPIDRQFKVKRMATATGQEGGGSSSSDSDSDSSSSSSVLECVVGEGGEELCGLNVDPVNEFDIEGFDDSDSDSESDEAEAEDEFDTDNIPSTPPPTPTEEDLLAQQYERERAIAESERKREEGPEAAYAPPQILSLRSSQLPTVGYPLDHRAVVWCRPLLAALTSAMHQLHLISPDEEVNPVGLASLLGVPAKTKEELVAAAGLSHEDGAILPTRMLRAMERNMTRMAWDEAQEADVRYMHNAIGTMQAEMAIGAIRFGPIVVAYFVIAYLTLAAIIFRKLSGFNVGSWVALLSPWKHTGLDGLVPYWATSAAEAMPLFIAKRFKNKTSQLTTCITIAFFAVLAAVLALVQAIIMAWWSPEVGMFSSALGPKPQSYQGVALVVVAAYGVAIAIRTTFIIAATVVGWSINAAFTVVNFLLRCTIWCKPIRTRVRAVCSTVKGKFLSINWLKELAYTLHYTSPSFPMTILTAMASSMAIMRFTRLNGDELLLDPWLFFSACVGYVSFFLAVILMFAGASTYMDSRNSDLNAKVNKGSKTYLICLLALYAPAILLGAPTFLFSHSLLMGDPRSIEATADLLSMFWYSTLVNTFSIAVMSLHLWWAMRGSCRAQMVPWMGDVTGPSSKNFLMFDAALTKSFPWRNFLFISRAESDKEKLERATGNAACIHDDGGDEAVYEECNEGTPTKAANVVLGSTYRVTSCACWEDATLDPKDWCDWCRCPKCGMKAIPANHRARSSSVLQGQAKKAPTPTVPLHDPEKGVDDPIQLELYAVLDLVLALGFVGAAFASYYYGDQPCNQLGIAGSMAAMQLFYYTLRANLTYT